MTSFSASQQAAIAEGAKLAKNLAARVQQALKINSPAVEVKRHTYIMSPPGAGKTFTVQAVANEHNLDLVKIQGIASMSAVVIKLAVAVHSLDAGDFAVVWIDDCDNLFMDSDSLNVMKGVLDEERNVLAYNKNLTSQIRQYEASESPQDRVRAEALRAFQSPGSVGVEIPTSQLRFIITSNKSLTKPNAALNTAKKMNEAAIRDRVNYIEFSNLDAAKSWGWIASVVLNSNVLELDAHQKYLLLDFMHKNWEALPSTSMRKVKDLAAMMLNHPANFQDQWAMELSA
jgi:hypothetical protein